MNITFNPKFNSIYFGAKSSTQTPQTFKPEYDEFVSRSKQNHRIGQVSFINFHKKADIIAEAFKDTPLNKKAYIKCMIKVPMLSVCNPETIINNVNETVARFENEKLTKKAYLKAAMKQPVILLQSPDTIENNIRELAQKYKEYGLSDIEYLKMALSQPSLFSQSPETISNNINTILTRYKDSGLTTNDYIKSIKRYPSIMCLSPKKIEQNIADIVEKYSKYGLDEEKYIKMLTLSPIGFCINAQNKINSITKLVETLKPLGMTEEKCIHTFLRQPPAFFSNMESMTERIKFLTFAESEKLVDNGINTINKTQCLDNALMKSMSYSQELNYLVMLRDKLKSQCNTQITYRHLKENIKDFVRQNQSKVFEFKISRSEYTEDFINFIETYSKQLTGKNIFKVIIR